MQLRGKCACGSVSFEVNGEPRVQLYCHCHSCRTAHASPVVAIGLFKSTDVTCKGETTIVTITGREDATKRHVCTKCGTRVWNEPRPTLRAVFPVLCETSDWFHPQMHIFFADHVLEVRDELPKYLDLPQPMGGSGKTA